MKEVNIFKLIKDSFVKGFIRGFEKANRIEYPYKLFLGDAEIGYFQSLNFKNQYVELEKGIVNVNYGEGFEKPQLMIFNIKGPINVFSFRIETMSMGQMVGKQVVAFKIVGSAEVVHNLDFFENGKD